jgi:hypothetical protein
MKTPFVLVELATLVEDARENVPARLDRVVFFSREGAK